LARSLAHGLERRAASDASLEALMTNRPNQSSQPLAGALSHFNRMKQLSILARSALASGG
jgi:hypothetical protein